MPVLTSQKLKEFYERYKSIEMTFSKEVVAVTGLDARQVHVKCVSDFFPCIIYSTSFEGAKVVINVKSGILERLQQANNMMSLRFCFRHFETGQQVIFLVQGRVSGHTPYNGSEDMAVFSLQYSQHPPDDLIEIIGRVLDANMNAAKRKEERIFILPETMRKLHLLSKDVTIFIDSVPRRCILRDLSFSGAKIVMVGLAKFLVDKPSSLRIEFEDPHESYNLKGRFIRAELVESRKDLVILGMLFSEPVPMAYKIRISDFLTTVKAGSPYLAGTAQESQQAAAPAGATAGAQAAGAAAAAPAEAPPPAPDAASDETG